MKSLLGYKASNEEAGKRVDLFVSKQLPTLSRASVQKLCEQGKIRVNKKSPKPSQKLKEGDKITVDFEIAETVPKIDLPVIYEDADCVVINKPVGVLSHSKGAFNPEATVASWLQPRLSNLAGERAGIVHRLDRATSGVMICAKNPEAQAWLQKQFAQRKVKKTYIAVIKGQLDPPAAIIDMPIERHPKKPQTFRVGASGKSAQTEYQTLQFSDFYSLLELKPATGRTHQLRVHLAELKHSIVGDSLYGGQLAERLFLHALRLEVTLPSRERKLFEAPLPATFKEKLR